MEDYILTGLVSLMVWFMYKWGKQPAIRDLQSGNLIVRHHKFTRYLMLFTFLFGSCALIVFLNWMPFPRKANIVFILIFSLMSVAGATVSIDIFAWLEISKEGIANWTVYKGNRFVRWEDFIEVKFSAVMGRFTMTSNRGELIKFDQIMIGAGELASLIKERIAEDRVAGAEAGFELLLNSDS